MIYRVDINQFQLKSNKAILNNQMSKY